MYQMCRILMNLKSEATVGHQAIDQQLLDLPRGGKLMQDLSRAAVQVRDGGGGAEVEATLTPGRGSMWEPWPGLVTCTLCNTAPISWSEIAESMLISSHNS